MPMPTPTPLCQSLIAACCLCVAMARASAPSAPQRAAPSSASSGVAKRAVITTWPLNGDGGWDYLLMDPSRPRLFVTRATHVDVLDTHTGALLGTIDDTDGVHGIALAPDLKRGFTSNGKGDSVTVFDFDTLRVIQVAPVPAHNPDAILYDPAGAHVFTFNGKTQDVTVLDAHSMAVVKTLPMPDKPEFAANDGEGKIFVNIETEPGQMVVIDAQALTVLHTWTLPGCNRPTGLALDQVHHRLFSVCADRVMVVTDATRGRQVAQVTIGDGPDAAAYDAKRKLIYSSNSDGTLSVIHQDAADRYQLIDTVVTKRGARTLALDSASGRVYTISADFTPAPAATPQQPHPRPTPVAGSIAVMEIGAP